MQRRHTILCPANYKTSKWQGGTTTELFIFPINSDYNLRNFKFRLSTATVEQERSVFTSLPGVSRKLMILDGSITIDHEGHYSKEIGKFDIDAFQGDWKTASIGKCTDFNLMTRDNVTGILEAVIIGKGHNYIYEIKDKCDWLFIYLFKGKIMITVDSNTDTMNSGALFFSDQLTPENINIKSVENSELIISHITI